MTYLYLYIPGMAHEVQLSESADRIPITGFVILRSDLKSIIVTHTSGITA